MTYAQDPSNFVIGLKFKKIRLVLNSTFPFMLVRPSSQQLSREVPLLNLKSRQALFLVFLN